MGRPVWVTKAGDLGVIAERQFYNLRFDVIDPDDGALTYSVVGGSLPSGLSLKDDGFIEGIPTVRKVFIRGVPTDVAEDVVNTFCVRVQTETGDVSDRTFTLTVSGQDAPVITTDTERLGTYFDGDYFEFQLVAVDLDDDVLTWNVSNGSLPNGLTLDPSTGLISGYINLVLDTDYGQSGWFNTDWDVTPWDFRTQSVNKNYQFTISVTDGKDFALQNYRIFIVSKDGMTADNNIITADAGSPYTADLDSKRNPALLTTGEDLGVILHDNYFAYKFDGVDFDGDVIEYQIVSGSVPGLTLDSSTGWFYGQLPAQALLEISYSISVRVVKRDWPTTYVSDTRTITFTIVGDIGKFVQWETDTNLGTITNGSVSEFYVRATNGLGRTLYYRLADNYLSGTVKPATYEFTGDGSTTEFVIDTTVNPIAYNTTVTVDGVEQEVGVDWTWDYPDTSADQQFYIIFTTPPADTKEIVITVTDIDYGGVDSTTSSVQSAGRLPQGLTLLSNGLISGRASFNGFTIDGATTTFDVLERRTTSTTTPTTFDNVSTFVVEVYDLEGDISTFKTFKIQTELTNSVPYDNMYAVAMLPREDRLVWRDMINDANIIPSANIYRANDPYFGISTDIRLLVAAGVYPDTAENVQAAVAKNHYNKRIQLGDIKTARALDSSGNVKYEVVYVEISDDRATADGVSSSRSLNLGNVSISGGFDPIIYPNSFFNMRQEIYDNLTQVNPLAIPDWMSSKQADGRILGLINAAVICYTEPGKALETAFKISRSNYAISEFDAVLDRYVWDNNLTEYYDTTLGSFVGSAETTFDKFVTITPYPLVDTVNYAVSIPFSEINGRTLDHVVSLGLDGITAGIASGQKLIFVKQEDYSTLSDDEAWTRYTTPFDESGFDSVSFDEATIIQGYDGSSVNERVAVYTISITSNIVTLTKTLDVVDNDRIDILRGGVAYGGQSLYLNPSILDGNTVPTFSKMEDITEGSQTSFDNNGTRFFAYKDVYAGPDDNDAYIKWPQVGVFE